MLDQPLTVGTLLVVNGTTMLPIIILLAKGVWHLSKTAHKVDQMWAWYTATQINTRQGRTHRLVEPGE